MKANPITQFLFTHGARQFIARIYRDETMGPPWMVHDGHCIMANQSRMKTDHEGEYISIGCGHYVDVTASIELAMADAWGKPDAWPCPDNPTPAQVARAAVEADAAYLRRFMRDDWYWVGVSVAPIGADGSIPDETYNHALWGIESDSTDYIRGEVCRELADDVPESAPIAAPTMIHEYVMEFQTYHDEIVGRLKFKRADGSIEESALCSLGELENLIAVWQSGELLGSFAIGARLALNASFKLEMK